MNLKSQQKYLFLFVPPRQPLFYEAQPGNHCSTYFAHFAFFKHPVTVMDGSPKVSITIFECYPYYPVTTPPSNPTFVSGKPGRPGNPVHNFVIWIDLWHHLLFFPPPFVSFVFISKTTTTILSCPVNPVDPVNPHHFVIWSLLWLAEYHCSTIFGLKTPSAPVNSQNIFCSTMQPVVEHWTLYYS